MEFNNFTIKISSLGEQLNIVYYVTSDLDVMSNVDRESLFNDSFYSMSTDTVWTSSITRVNCDIFDFVEFCINEGDSTIESVTYTKLSMQSEMASVPYTLGQFIDAQYQTISTTAKNI